ncbi:MAG: rRNA pseudouridine synthase [Niastella sp.]|nr:rRNA pseudouridine synthase [Niastella sp.]
MERKKKQAEKAQNPESRTQHTEYRSQKSEVGSKKPATGNQQSAVKKPQTTGNKPPFEKRTESKQPFTKAPANRPAFTKAPAAKAAVAGNKPKLAVTKSTQEAAKPASGKAAPNVIPLNKFIAHSGITSRRDAADIVKSGTVVVNGKVVTEPGFKVSKQDEVKVNGKVIQIRQTMVYILINKPKDFITTTEDPQGRKTVLDIIKNATTERIYPVGRLDRNTTGVLLLTNDGELAQKLTHPSYMVKKIYEVKLDKPLVKKDFDAIVNGITLEDGFIAPDALAYADSKDKSIIGIEIHSGRNRIVRRIFEHMGYDVRNLDRVMYANLTKKNVDRGKWRFLNEKEVRLLKYLNSSYTKKQNV